MSNIYIQEPPTHGKVLLETTVGDIDVELWAKETPKACRNFVQLCMEGYYTGTIFHRVVKGFIVQGGDPTGTGTGGESIYGQPFKDEFHTRLRFVRRGLVAMANAGKDDNGSQFFFTFDACPELQNKHTIFGKVAGNTVFNMLKLEECLVGHDERPTYPHKILNAKVLFNPFDDIIPRAVKGKDVTDHTTDNSKVKVKATKNFKLLSFGDEAEEDEEETDVLAQEYRGKSKSSHDLTNDPKLSSVPAVEVEERADKRKLESSKIEHDEEAVGTEVEDTQNKEQLERIHKKLKKPIEDSDIPQAKASEDLVSDDLDEHRQKVDGIRNEIKQLKKELSSVKKRSKLNQDPSDAEASTETETDTVAEYKASVMKYKNQTKEVKKDIGREKQTLELLAKFQNKLQTAKETNPVEEKEELADDDETDEGWMTHKLHCETLTQAAKDASINDADTYEIFDPRNPINQRRREASKQAMLNKKR